MTYFAAPSGHINQIGTVPAPIGGINARDSLIQMAPTDAISMRNWWPQPYGCTVRKGTRKWVTGLGSAVKTLFSRASETGVQSLYAWAGTSMFDVTTTGVVGAAAVTGLSNAIWQAVNFTNAAGTAMIAVNGVDNGIIVDSGGVARLVAGDGIVAHTWAGLNPANAVQLTVHQHRLWVVKLNTSAGYYLPPDAVQGTFVKFDFGPLWQKGGYLQFLTTWTLDDGNGAEDHLVAVSSRGEAAVFAGTDPSNDTLWHLVGVYFIGAPVAGRRSYTKLGGDLGILTQQGVVSMTNELASTKVNTESSKLLSEKVQFLISELISSQGALADWAIVYVPKINMLLINVPSTVSKGNIQLVSNQIINAWTEFTEIDAACWSVLDSNLFYGDYAGNVCQAWTGTLDNVAFDGSGGASITSACEQAYSSLGQPAAQKQVGMYRPNLLVTDSVSFNSAIAYDFDTAELLVPGAPVPSISALWNTALWNTSLWAGSDKVQRSWIQSAGIGHTVSLQIAMQSTNEVLWISTDYSYIGGLGIL